MLQENERQQPLALQLESVPLIALYAASTRPWSVLIRLSLYKPETATWQYLRTQAQASLNNNEAAMRDLEKALELSPEHVPSLLAMANVEMLRGDFEAAEVRSDTLRDLIPGRSELDAVAERKAAGTAGPPGDVPAEKNSTSRARKQRCQRRATYGTRAAGTMW